MFIVTVWFANTMSNSSIKCNKKSQKNLTIKKHILVLVMIFLDLTPKTKTTKAKINRWNNFKLKSFCITNETFNKMKR